MNSYTGNDFQPDPSGQGRSRDHSSHHHHRHHRHSSRREKTQAREYKNIKRHRLEDEPKRQHLQKIENFIIKNIISIFGIIFIAGAIWFGIGTWRSLESSSIVSPEKSKSTEQSVSGKINSVASSLLSPGSIKPAGKMIDTSMILVLAFSMVFILTTLGVSVRQKMILLKTMSFLAWVLVSSWLMTSLFATLDSLLFYILVIQLSVFFALFFFSGFVDSYIGRSKWKYRVEYWFLLINSLFYFLVMSVVLYKTGYKNYISVFIFLLSTVHLFAIYYADKKSITFNKIPYLIAALIITCSFLPLVLKVSQLIVFLAPLSVFLILFSKYSRNQASVLFSLGAMSVMAVFYLYQWIFRFIPEVFFRDNVMTRPDFYKGLVSGIFILAAFAINNRLLKRLSISFSQKWLAKGKYLKYLKGILLSVQYLALYWIFNYILMIIVKDERLDFMIWLSYNCLYFLFYIPHLARQKSSFLRLMIISSIVSSLTYFTLFHFNVVHFRNQYIEGEGTTIFSFLFHYFPLALVVAMLFTLLRYFKRAFAGKKVLIKGFWVFFYLMSVFILITEFDHLAVLYGFHHGIKIREILAETRGLPYSLILLLSCFLVLTLGFMAKSRFLRLFSLVILTIILVKILAYDMATLQAKSKMILFLFMGIFLFGISIFYPRIKQSFFQKDSPQSGDNSAAGRKHRRK